MHSFAEVAAATALEKSHTRRQPVCELTEFGRSAGQRASESSGQVFRSVGREHGNRANSLVLCMKAIDRSIIFPFPSSAAASSGLESAPPLAPQLVGSLEVSLQPAKVGANANKRPVGPNSAAENGRRGGGGGGKTAVANER